MQYLAFFCRGGGVRSHSYSCNLTGVKWGTKPFCVVVSFWLFVSTAYGMTMTCLKCDWNIVFLKSMCCVSSSPSSSVSVYAIHLWCVSWLHLLCPIPPCFQLVWKHGFCLKLYWQLASFQGHFGHVSRGRGGSHCHRDFILSVSSVPHPSCSSISPHLPVTARVVVPVHWFACWCNNLETEPTASICTYAAWPWIRCPEVAVL